MAGDWQKKEKRKLFFSLAERMKFVGATLKWVALLFPEFLLSMDNQRSCISKTNSRVSGSAWVYFFTFRHERLKSLSLDIGSILFFPLFIFLARGTLVTPRIEVETLCVCVCVHECARARDIQTHAVTFGWFQMKIRKVLIACWYFTDVIFHICKEQKA